MKNGYEYVSHSKFMNEFLFRYIIILQIKTFSLGSFLRTIVTTFWFCFVFVVWSRDWQTNPVWTNICENNDIYMMYVLVIYFSWFYILVLQIKNVP